MLDYYTRAALEPFLREKNEYCSSASYSLRVFRGCNGQ
jgi:hypothetical protein